MNWFVRHVASLGCVSILWGTSPAFASDCIEARKLHADAQALGLVEVNYAESVPLFRNCILEGRASPRDRYLLAEALYESRNLHDAIEEGSELIGQLEALPATPGLRNLRGQTEYLLLRAEARLSTRIDPDATLDRLLPIQQLFRETGDSSSLLLTEVFRGYLTQLRGDIGSQQSALAILVGVLNRTLGPVGEGVIANYQDVLPTVLALKDIQTLVHSLGAPPPPQCLKAQTRGVLPCLRRAIELAEEGGDPGLLNQARQQYELLVSTDSLNLRPEDYRENLRFWQHEFDRYKRVLTTRQDGRLADGLSLAGQKMAEAVLYAPERSSLSFDEFAIVRSVFRVADRREGAERALNWLQQTPANQSLDRHRRVLLARAQVVLAEHAANPQQREVHLNHAWEHLQQLPGREDMKPGKVSMLLDPVYYVYTELCRGEFFELKARSPLHEQNKQNLKRAVQHYQAAESMFALKDLEQYLNGKRWLSSMHSSISERIRLLRSKGE